MEKQVTYLAHEYSEIVLADYNFANSAVYIIDGRAVWQNLHKVQLVNTNTKNDQGLSVLIRIMLGIKDNTLNDIQVLYSNLICSIKFLLVCDIDTGEDTIMCHGEALYQQRVGNKKKEQSSNSIFRGGAIYQLWSAVNVQGFAIA